MAADAAGAPSGGARRAQGGAGVEASIGHAETLPAVRQSPARPTSSVTTAFAPAHHVLRHLLHEHRPASPKCAPRIATSLAQPDHGPRPARPRPFWHSHSELCGHSQRGLWWQESSSGVTGGSHSGSRPERFWPRPQTARRTEIRHGTARLTIAVMWPRCLHDVSPSLCRSASSRAPSVGSGSNGMKWSV